MGKPAAKSKNATKSNTSVPTGNDQEFAEMGLLLAEFSEGWGMIREFDSRRHQVLIGIAIAAFSVVGAMTASAANAEDEPLLFAITVSLVGIVSFIGSMTARTYVTREFDAKGRYINKINTIRKKFLEQTSNVHLREFLTNYQDYGVKTEPVKLVRPDSTVGAVLKFLLVVMWIIPPVILFVWIYAFRGHLAEYLPMIQSKMCSI